MRADFYRKIPKMNENRLKNCENFIALETLFSNTSTIIKAEFYINFEDKVNACIF